METETKQILTSDGVPLEQSLKKAERRNKIKAFLLVAPLLLFLLITYIFPIGEMLTRSVDDKMVTNMLPKTFKAMESWDGQILDYEYFAMVKGGPNDANGEAMKVLREMTSSEGLAGSAKYIAYAPWRKSSIAVMEAGEPWFKDGKTNMVPHMPTAPANTKRYILMNPDFWADNQDEINEKWEAMKAGL